MNPATTTIISILNSNLSDQLFVSIEDKNSSEIKKMKSLSDIENHSSYIPFNLQNKNSLLDELSTEVYIDLSISESEFTIDYHLDTHQKSILIREHKPELSYEEKKVMLETFVDKALMDSKQPADDFKYHIETKEYDIPCWALNYLLTCDTTGLTFTDLEIIAAFEVNITKARKLVYTLTTTNSIEEFNVFPAFGQPANTIKCIVKTWTNKVNEDKTPTTQLV